MNESVELELKPELDTKVLEGELSAGRKVEEKEVEKTLNYDALSKEEQKAIDDFNSKIDIADTTQILQYGASAQNKISKFSDSVLEDVKTKSSGEVGDLLSSLVAEIKEFDTDIPVEEKKGLFGLFNNAKKQLDKIVAKYDKVENNIDKIEKNLEAHKLQMLKDIAVFDTMYEKNLEYFKEISLYIIAGEKKLEELKNVTLPELQKKAQESGEQLDVQ